MSSCPERERERGGKSVWSERELAKERKKGRKKERLWLTSKMQREGGINPVSYIKRNTIHVKERWDALK